MMTRQATGMLAIPRRVWPRCAFTLCAFLLALPLAALGLVPSAAFAHPATAARSATSTTGKTGSPAVDLTLHYRSTITLTQPNFLATDAQGNLYVSDAALNLVKMYNASDLPVRSFGSGTVGTGNGNFNDPIGIAVGGGVVYVVDSNNNQIQSFNQSSGAFINQFGSSQLNGPSDIAVGSNGMLYVTDTSNARIAEFSTSGTYLGSFGAVGTGNGQFIEAYGIAFNSTNDNLYVTDPVKKRVQEFTLGGSYVTQWGSASFSFPTGVAVDRAGMVYVVDQNAQTLYKFDPNGSLVGSYAAPKTTPFVPGTFVSPLSVAVSSAPNTPFAVYVDDGAIVQRFDQVLDPQLHTYQAQWGSSGTGPGQFSNNLNGAVVDLAGNVYVVDANNNRVEKFDQFGKFLLAFGSVGSGPGQFNGPYAITISPNGSTLYVTDIINNRVEEFSPSGTYLGQFGSAGSGTGQFSAPQAIASDGARLYVADTGNSRIEVFNTNGNYVSQFGSNGTGTTQFQEVDGIAVDIARQELFIADGLNNRVQVYTTGGSFVASLTTAASVALNFPVGVSTDQRGDVYIADSFNNRIVEVDVNLTHTTVFGTAGSGPGQFNFPIDAVVSPASGQLYVVDNGTSQVQRWGSPWPKNDTVGIYRPSTKTFYLRNENSTGPAEIVVPMPYAQAGDLPIVGDWNGDGVDTVGLYRTSTGNFLLQDANVRESAPDYVFTLGIPGDTPIAGDWSGDGFDGAGIFRPSNGILYLKNSLSTGYADYNLVLGIPGDKGIAGDWNGDGQDSPGVYRPSNQTFYVTNKVTDGIVYSDATAVLGISGDVPFTGDWVAQGSSGIGVFRPTNGITYEKNAITTGFADNFFIYGIAGDIPVAGQWVEPTVTFSKPAPHVSLGSHPGSAAGSAAPHPASGGSSHTPRHTAPAPSAAATPRRFTPR